MTKQKRVLITGAAGFIGYHLAKHLHNRGDQVVGYDNFNDYYNPLLKRERAHQLAKDGIAVVHADITDKALLESLIENQGTTHIVHLAAQAGVRYSLTHPDIYLKSNIDGFLSILELLRHKTHIPLVYASSSSVYGTNAKIPFSEEDRTDTQANLYGVTKKANELMAASYHHLYGISTTGLRFFTVYGPWGRPDMATYLFTKAIDRGQTIDLYNYGKMRRDFTYIDDIIQGTTAALDLEGKNEIFNLGNHQSEPLSALVGSIEKNLGKKALVRELPMQPGEIETTYADITHAQKMLGFQPKTSLQEGVAHFVSWYKEVGSKY